MECIQQRTSAIHEELLTMTPKITDQFSTLRRELKDVQRSLVDLQRRLPASHQEDSVFEPLPHIEEGCHRSIKTPTRSSRLIVDEDSDADGQCCSAGGTPLPAAQRLGDSRGSWRPPVHASSQAGSGPTRDLV